MKKTEKRLFKAALILAAAVVTAAIVFVILSVTKVITVNPFRIGFAIFTLGIGFIFSVYGIIVKGGYETAVGGLLLIIGLTVVLWGKLPWYAIVLIDAGLIILALLGLFIMKSGQLVPERTDEKEGYKPYSETLAEKKAKQAEEDQKPLPELKDYSDKKED